MMKVSTVASSSVKDYVGPSDICMMYSVTDPVQGIQPHPEQSAHQRRPCAGRA